MNERDLDGAASALVRWFESQEIQPIDSVGVMVLVLCGILRKTNAPAAEGAALLADVIKEMLEDNK